MKVIIDPAQLGIGGLPLQRIPIKMWLDPATLEASAYEQAYNLTRLPFAFNHIALMSDCHSGFGMPIGGVLATEGVIIPNCVGVDIGCGMVAVRTSLTSIDKEILKKVLSAIRERIPLGPDHNKESQAWDGFNSAPDIQIVQQQLKAASYQLSSLGGGNHFLECQLGSDGHVWLMLHSGSRNFGYKIAEAYHKKALSLCERWHSDIPNKDLSFLPMESPEAKEYFSAMNFALEFAKENRFRMIEIMKESIAAYVKEVKFDETLNVHHNYARWENHYGKNVIVHRKGATSAREGELGIIPGSQGTKSYIVRGKGNFESFNSCSHGAGRLMGRKDAIRRLDLKAEQKLLDDQGIIHSIRNQGDLDEAPSAYKNIDTVIANQADLVEIVTELRPLAVIKA
jgi:tRNA-splicing ligase RtcB (3'-phosphate/5'-hydroxy nucleic acid ligase)